MSYQSVASSNIKTLYNKPDDLLSRVRDKYSENGELFLQDYSQILSNPSTATTLKPSSDSTLSLNSYGEALSNRIKDFQMLDNSAPDKTEWNKAFGQQSDESDWSVLESLGSGLLTAAKFALGAAAIL